MKKVNNNVVYNYYCLQQILTKEQNAHKQFLQRLFPDVEVTETESFHQWQNDFEKAVRAHFASSQPDNAVDVAKLHSEVQHYKQIIDETVNTLKYTGWSTIYETVVFTGKPLRSCLKGHIILYLHTLYFR